MAWTPPSDTAPNVDSGFITLGTSFTVVETSAMWLLGIFASNITAGNVGEKIGYITITDTAGSPVCYKAEVVPNKMFPAPPIPFAPMTGLKVICDVSATVVAKLWGRK